jgi:hypothetical protein
VDGTIYVLLNGDVVEAIQVLALKQSTKTGSESCPSIRALSVWVM